MPKRRETDLSSDKVRSKIVSSSSGFYTYKVGKNKFKERKSNYDRLDQQIEWYDEESIFCQRWYKRFKYAEILTAALIPFVILVGNILSCPSDYHYALIISSIVAAALGGLVVILESIQQVTGWGRRWMSYRSTCESLRHEKFAYLGRFGPYHELAKKEALKILMERTELLISRENSKWVETSKENVKG